MNNNHKCKITQTLNSEARELLLEVDIGNGYTNEELVIDVSHQLEQLEIPKGIEIVKIDGRLSVTLAYVFADKLQDKVDIIAVKYPQEHKFIVTKSNDNQLISIGDSVLPTVNESFTANLYQDTLNLSCQLGIVSIQQLSKEAARTIDQLIENEIIKSGDLLKVNGKSAIIVNFIIAQKIAHLYQNIAIFVPGLNAYVVVIRKEGGQYEIGDLINSDTAKTPNQKKIVICGAANRGKTVLRDCLNRVLNQYIMSNNDYFVISGCPDGDGAWYNECHASNPAEAKRLKDKYKREFTERFANNKAQEIEVINTPLLLFDVGGKMTDDHRLTKENCIIMSKATHALIVGGDEAEIAPWPEGCKSLGITVIAEVISKTGEGKDIVNTDNQLCTATIHNLVRGGQIPQGVHDLARFLAQSILTPQNPA